MCLVWTWIHMKYGTYLSPDVGPPALPSYMIQGTNTTECLRKSTWRRLNTTALVCPPEDRNNYSGSDQSLGREHWKLCLVYRVWALAGWWDPAGGGLCFVPSPVNTLPSPSHWPSPASVILALCRTSLHFCQNQPPHCMVPVQWYLVKKSSFCHR